MIPKITNLHDKAMLKIAGHTVVKIHDKMKDIKVKFFSIIL